MKEDELELLKNHVWESNAIENVFVEPSHHLFVDHLAAAEFVFNATTEFNVIIAPKNIHRLLMRRELKEAGEFRKVKVWVGSNLKPSPELVEELMGRWQELIQREMPYKDSFTPEYKEKIAWHYHHWFEAIHPFIDGNGRTGRLILNNIRLSLGLSWLVVNFSERQEYYASISEWVTNHRGFVE